MSKVRFIIALIFVCAFLVTSAFVVVYGLITKTMFWDSYQPYFTAMIGPVGIILGYYFSTQSNNEIPTPVEEDYVNDNPEVTP